jgi:hypothetical protein
MIPSNSMWYVFKREINGIVKIRGRFLEIDFHLYIHSTRINDMELKFRKNVSSAREEGMKTMNNPEIGGKLVRLSHKLNSSSSKSQVIKVGDKYFRVKELG